MVDLKVFSDNKVEELLSDLEKAGCLADLEEKWTALLSQVPAAHLRRLSSAVCAWREREEAFKKLENSLEASNLPALPQLATEKALVPHKIWALGRAVKMCPKSDFEGDEKWAEALAAHVDTWSGAVNLSLKRGEMRCRLIEDHPQVKNFEDYARRRESLSNLANHRWMASRRGEKVGALSISIDWPKSNIQSFVHSMLPRMGPAAGKRGEDSVSEELIWNDLPGTLRLILDRRAEDEAVRSAINLYNDLLESSPLGETPVGAVNVGPVGKGLSVAIVTGFDTLEKGEIIDVAHWETELLHLLRGKGLSCILVPNTAPDKELLSDVRKTLALHFTVMPVRSAALMEARIRILEQQPGLEPGVASALALANRALDPAKAWSQVDPVSIGLAEYQNDIGKERLANALLEARRLFFFKRHSGESNGALAGQQGKGKKAFSRKAPAAPAIKPNPLVKSIKDLRPGMTVTGLVSNITRFGVFVNLGLEEEGMIHISELSDGFISAPEEAVSLGQQVNARVLEVDPAKKRVALTMKTGKLKEKSGAARSSSTGNGDFRSGPRNSSRKEQNRASDSRRGNFRERPTKGSRGRSEALRQLEDLFKK